MKKTSITVGQVPEQFRRRRVPKVPLIVVALLAGTVGAYALISSFAASQNTNCFPAPSACGYPDATNTGVPAGTKLTASGDITASTPGQVINGMDVSGSIMVTASNVTIENTRVTQDTTCGSTNACGNYAIGVAANASNVTIKNVETRTASGQSCQQDIRSGGPNLTIENSYLHACDGNLYAVAPTTLKDSYALAKIDISTDHIENIYMSDTTVNVNHSTLFNPVEQTATIFGNVNGGQGGTCDNHITATDSFLVGGGYTIYACAHGTGAGSSSAVVTNNRFARCLGTETVTATGGNHVCQGGTDAHGYYPNGGSYGLASSMYSNVTTWSGNIWDDNGQSVCADGSNGCAGSGGTTPTPPADTTPPTVSLTAPSSNATVSGSSVTVSADASDDTGVTGVQFKLDGSNLGSEDTSSPYKITWDTTKVADGSHTLTAVARDAAGNTKTSSSVKVTIDNSGGGGGSGGSTGATRTSNCFSQPSACGYPDATNTGVPAGTALTPSGSITASTPGQVINAKDVTGSIEIDANNVTVENTRVTLNSGSCGTTTTCGNSEIRINEGVTGTVIKDSELTTANGVTCEHDIRNTSSGTVQIIGDYLHGCDSNLYNVGNATMTDTYGIAKIAISTDHVENIYFSDSTMTVNHSTLLNPVGQTAVVFGNTNGGSGDNNACDNHLTVSNSLFAGGGFTIYPCAHASTAGTSATSVTNTHFARCLTTPVYHSDGGNTTCQGGADSNGYYPGSGNYGVAAYYQSKATTWTGNTWDDNGQSICIDGSNGCAGSGGDSGGGGGGSSDTTAPSVSFVSPNSGATVSGTFTANASASDNVRVTKVDISLDGALKMTDTSSPYNYSFDSKTLSNGSHTLSAKAYDAAGNTKTATVTFTVNNPDITPPSAPTGLTADATSATTVKLAWNASTDSGTGATGVAKYDVLRNGVVIAQPTTTSYTDTSAVANTSYSYIVQAVDGAGNVSGNSPAATVKTPTVGGTQTDNCFPKPSACGYPDTTNTGVPAGTTLTPSGSITASTNGQVIDGKDITGELVVNAPNVTLKNSKVHTNDGGSGSTAIILNNGATNFTIEDSEVYGNGSKTNAPESGVWNHYGNSGFKVIRSYIHGSPDNIEGPADVEDSYLIVDAEYSGAHSENIYLCGEPATVNHSTVYNESDETSLIFGDGICDTGNQVSVKNSLLAGGGWMLQPDSKGVSAPVTITDNRVGRCLGSSSQDSGGGYVCKGGADSNGYWPYGGHYGLATDLGNKLTWSGNVWDDNSKTICPTQDGTGSCSPGGGTTTPPTDTTAPSVPSDLKATAVSATQVDLSWKASTDSGGSGLAGYNVYRDGKKLNKALITGTSYGDATTEAATTYSYTVRAVDGAGNASDQSASASVTTPAAPDNTPPSVPKDLKATATSATEIDLSWSASTDSGGSGLAGYNVYRDGQQLNSVPLSDTTYQDAKVTPDTTYTYVVQAVDKAGNASDKSASASITTPSGPTTGGGNDLLLGSNEVQGAPDNDAAGSPEAFKYKAVASGQAKSISLYIDRGSAAKTVVAGIYADDNGNPGTLLASGSIHSPTAMAWNSIPLTSQPAITSGTTYWMTVLGVGGQINFRDALSGNCSQSPNIDNLASLTGSWKAGGQHWKTCKLSGYVSSSSAPAAGQNPPTGGHDHGGYGVGIVVYDHHHRPVRGALVTVAGQTVTTDRHGRANFRHVAAGHQSVSISYKGKKISRSINVKPSPSSTRNTTPKLFRVSIDQGYNPLLLLVPVVVLLAAGGLVTRPWEKFAKESMGISAADPIVSSGHPDTTSKPGRRIEAPGAVYSPENPKATGANKDEPKL